MKKNKHAFSRGFTLIELMIVIVILGILMGTILPRLTGAQARARDTARKADLTNIAQALESYNSDNGSYPAESGGTGCLDSAAGGNASGTSGDITYVALGKYLKGGKVPAAVSKKQVTATNCTGSYYYKPIEKAGIANASYILASDVETWQLANFSGDVTDADITIKVGTDQVTEEHADPTLTVYVIMP